MPADLRLEAAQFWLDYARSDLEAAHACWERPGVHGWTIAFHCQQAVEKAYKGALTLHELEVPKSHNLVGLHAMLAEAGLQPKFPIDIPRGHRFGMQIKAQGAERLSRTCVRRLREATQQRRDAPKAVDRGQGPVPMAVVL